MDESFEYHFLQRSFAVRVELFVAGQVDSVERRARAGIDLQNRHAQSRELNFLIGIPRPREALAQFFDGVTRESDEL